MGRLNYTNRKTEGLKLGQTIAKDLTKRIPPGTGSKSALRDPVVELDVTGRCLGEEGFRELAGPLITSLEYNSEHGRIVQLEELCLRTNRLNATCLPALARIVRLAAFDLRDLDLSDNCFSISNSQDADAWEEFLESFAKCCVLRRVDLSDNPLGPKAFETLVRVYSREKLIDQTLEDPCGALAHDRTSSRRSISRDAQSLNRQTRNLSLGSTPGFDTDDDESISPVTSKLVQGIRHDSKSPEKGGQGNLPDLFPIYNHTRGLRSIPYLVLSHTDMTDTGALHLSYIISCHHHPDRLLRYVPAAKSSHHIQQLDVYDNNTGCQGMIYLPSNGFTTPGLRLLELCEGARFSLLDDDRPAQSPDAVQTHCRRASAPKKASVSHSSPFTVAAGTRRRSGTKGENDELTDVEAVIAELDRARSRIQGNVLKDVGAQSNDLWRTALRMLRSCRMLCPIGREEYPQAPRTSEASNTSIQPIQEFDFPTLSKATQKPFVGYLDPFAPPLAAKNPNMPITPKAARKQQPPKLKTTAPNSLSLTTSPTTTSPVAFASPLKSYKSDLPHGLPEEAWARIMCLQLGADRFMSWNQQRNVLRWAVDRKTLARELESLGKPESAQIWKVLDGMGCLAYEGDGA